jgi:hypothetical protein
VFRCSKGLSILEPGTHRSPASSHNTAPPSPWLPAPVALAAPRRLPLNTARCRPTQPRNCFALPLQAIQRGTWLPLANTAPGRVVLATPRRPTHRVRDTRSSPLPARIRWSLIVLRTHFPPVASALARLLLNNAPPRRRHANRRATAPVTQRRLPLPSTTPRPPWPSTPGSSSLRTHHPVSRSTTSSSSAHTASPPTGRQSFVLLYELDAGARGVLPRTTRGGKTGLPFASECRGKEGLS